MLAAWNEFGDLLRVPDWADSRIERVEGDGGLAVKAVRPSGEERDVPVVAGNPCFFTSRSLASVEALQARSSSPVQRRGNWLRLLKGRLMGTAKQSAAHFARFKGLLLEVSARPMVLMVGAATPGGGAGDLYEDAGIRLISFDIYPSPLTQFLADAHEIPLADASVDGVCVQAVLEHVLDPARVVAEIARVLKPGGVVYAETPFMQQVHEGAYDFTRFTELGHRWLWRDFEPVARGALGGPGLSLYWSARYFFRGLTRSRALGDVLSLPFAAAALADRFIPESHRVDGANGVYFLGRRRAEPIDGRALIPQYLGAQR